MSCLLAICLQLSAGETIVNQQDCGIWYVCEEHSPYKLHRYAPTVAVGAAGRHWRAGFQSLGHTQTDALVPEGPTPVLFHTTGSERGLYLEGVLPLGNWRLEGGLWAYRSAVISDIGAQHFSSGAIGYAPMAGLTYGGERVSAGVTVRGAENRSTDWNGNHQPGPLKAFATTFEIRVTL